MTATGTLLTLNAGSSSVRFALYSINPSLPRRLRGKVERLDDRRVELVATDGGEPHRTTRVGALGHHAIDEWLLDWLETGGHLGSLVAVGHRVVHGLAHAEPEQVTPRLLTELERLIPLAPEHLPRELALITAVRARWPRLPQVVCFDTAFHRTMPPVATQLPIPRRYAARGVQRYGFHGLSYAYVMRRLATLDPDAAKGRVIVAHLGNGASLAAIRHGRSIDTTMGFTPSGGIVMGTRSGEIDPGLPSYLARTARLSPSRFQAMTAHESGLLAISGTTADMRELLKNEGADRRAADAVALFCYQVKKAIGAYTAALGGLDTLVFTGGIGEHAATVRARICEGLGVFGIALQASRNSAHRPIISTDASRVKVRVIATDEEQVIARSTLNVVRRSARTVTRRV